MSCREYEEMEGKQFIDTSEDIRFSILKVYMDFGRDCWIAKIEDEQEEIKEKKVKEIQDSNEICFIP